jgi:hypothetical protein
MEQKLRFMGHDDDIVLNYLAKYPAVYVSAMEVCKRADSRRRFNESPDWAKPVLARLTQSRVLEVNASGHYRIKVEEEEEEEETHRREVSTMTAEEALGTSTPASATPVSGPPPDPNKLPGSGEQKKAA